MHRKENPLVLNLSDLVVLVKFEPMFHHPALYRTGSFLLRLSVLSRKQDTILAIVSGLRYHRELLDYFQYLETLMSWNIYGIRLLVSKRKDYANQVRFGGLYLITFYH